MKLNCKILKFKLIQAVAEVGCTSKCVCFQRTKEKDRSGSDDGPTDTTTPTAPTIGESLVTWMTQMQN